MTATLKPAIPAGGILAQNVERDFTDFVAGRTVEQRLLVTVVQAASVSSGNREAGRVNKTAYEAVHLVEVTDPHEVDRLRHLITQIRADRGLAVRQPALFDSTEDEQRESVLDLVKEWASERDVPLAELDERWVSYFGGAAHAASATVQTGSLLQLKEFALVIGAISDEPAGAADSAPPVLFAAPEPEDDDEDADLEGDDA